jgi:hypothetical protein
MHELMEKMAEILANSREHLEKLKKITDPRDRELRLLLRILETHLEATEVILSHYFDSQE